jgi:hypothetical protein
MFDQGDQLTLQGKLKHIHVQRCLILLQKRSCKLSFPFVLFVSVLAAASALSPWSLFQVRACNLSLYLSSLFRLMNGRATAVFRKKNFIFIILQETQSSTFVKDTLENIGTELKH